MSNTVTRKSSRGLKSEDYTGKYFMMHNIEEIWYLPELEGTEKQVNWANSIRSDFVRSANKGVVKAEEKFGVSEEDFLSKIEATLNEHTTAKFWIDNRHKM